MWRAYPKVLHREALSLLSRARLHQEFNSRVACANIAVVRWGIISRLADCRHRGCGDDNLNGYGTRMTEPVVLRPSRSLCAWAASLRAYLWLAGIFTAPEPTFSNRSLAVAIRSSRLAA